MKKIVYLLSISFVLVFFTSCFEEIDNWYTNTSAFDGRFTVATTCTEESDYNSSIKDGNEVLIYNSAANVGDEIWIDTHIAAYFDEDGNLVTLPIKGKFKVTGNSSEFKAGDVVANNSSNSEINDDEYYIIYDGDQYLPSDLGAPEEAGEEYDGVQLYSRFSLEEGKITPNGATTIGGNTSDGLSLKLVVYSDNIIIESYETPAADWSDPTVPEYAWRVKAGSRHNANDLVKHWTLTGYRYTGFPEDGNPIPPIITK